MSIGSSSLSMVQLKCYLNVSKLITSVGVFATKIYEMTINVLKYHIIKCP